MLLILSPAKTMSGHSDTRLTEQTTPAFQQEANEIALYLSQYSIDDLRKKLKLNPKLAEEAFYRFQNFHAMEEPPLQALLAYTGVVFKHIRPSDFSTAEFAFTQKHLRIVSICYGLLRPFDRIKPYRLEYDLKLPELSPGNLYNYWRDRQTDHLIEEVSRAGGILLNLASKDVQPAFHWKKVEDSVRIITPEFKVDKNGKLSTIVIYAKMARGELTRHIIKHGIDHPDAIQTFTWEGFRYAEQLSDTNTWTFLQDEA